MSVDLWLSILREIPTKYIVDLATGSLTLHGGVIRDLSGKIIAHLAKPMSNSIFDLVPGSGVIGSIVNGIQLASLSSDVAAVKAATEQILNYSVATTVFSGLGLVTALTGFAFVSARLNRIDEKLKSVEKKIDEIQEFLNSTQRARMLAAIDGLSDAPRTTSVGAQHDLLMQSRNTFKELTYLYHSIQEEGNKDIRVLTANHDYYVLACIGNVMATSELGMADVARDEMQKHYQNWLNISRKHCKNLLLGNNPARLLDSQYVESMRTTVLIKALDFANGTQRGIQWIDDLRKTLPVPGIASIFSSESRIDPLVTEYVIKLLATDNVLQGIVAQTDFLVDRKMSLSFFAHQAEKLHKRLNAEYLLLEFHKK